MKLNFFFDVDGTLLPFGEGLPESALKAIENVQKKGHRVFLSTGRSVAEVDPRLKAISFDGGVFSAGGKIMFQGIELWNRKFTQDEREKALSYLLSNKFQVMLQSDEGTFMSREAYDYFNESLNNNVGHTFVIPGLQIVDNFPLDIDVCKFLCLSPEGRVDEVRRDLGKAFDVIDNTLGLSQSVMAEICLKDVNKGTGIKKLLEFIGEERGSAVGIGDGANDIEMIEYCGLGIAMGNASEELKRKANWITSPVDKDGIKNALEYATRVYLKGLE